MNRVARMGCLIAALVGATGCIEAGEPPLESSEGGAAGDPAPTPGELEMSPAMREAAAVDELMALEPEALAVEVPEEVTVEKKIVGVDNRKPISKTAVEPYSTIATLLVTFPLNSKPGLCTGSLIATDAVLTAAHCVYNEAKGGWAHSMRVIPGAYPNGKGMTQQPFGSASALRSFAPSEYRDASDFWGREPHDYAVVRIGRGITSGPGLRAFATMANPRVGTAVKLVGYHGDKCAGAARCVPASSSFIMQTSSDSIRQVLAGDSEQRVFNHYADSSGGASGSPLVSTGDFANTIFAVHVAGLRDASGTAWNMGVLLTPTAVSRIKAWSRRAL